MFEDKIAEIQKRMLQLGLEYANNEVDKIYIYGSHENNLFIFNAFFEINGEIVKKHKININSNVLVPINVQESFLDLGLSDFKEFCEAFINNGKVAPTQLKLIYDNINKKANANYSYDTFYSNSDTLTADDIFNQWFEEVKAEVEGSK